MTKKEVKKILKDARNFLNPPANTITLFRIIDGKEENVFFAIGKTMAGYLNPVLVAYTCEQVVMLIKALEANNSERIKKIIKEKVADEEDKKSLEPKYIIRIKAIDHNQKWIQVYPN